MQLTTSIQTICLVKAVLGEFTKGNLKTQTEYHFHPSLNLISPYYTLIKLEHNPSCSLVQVVAVKQLDRNGFQGNREFLVEVLILSLLHHPHLVNLVGYCADGDQRILVYEYMANGSLEDHLLGMHQFNSLHLHLL